MMPSSVICVEHLQLQPLTAATAGMKTPEVPSFAPIAKAT